jgi:hypothetical protein
MIDLATTGIARLCAIQRSVLAAEGVDLDALTIGVVRTGGGVAEQVVAGRSA